MHVHLAALAAKRDHLRRTKNSIADTKPLAEAAGSIPTFAPVDDATGSGDAALKDLHNAGESQTMCTALPMCACLRHTTAARRTLTTADVVVRYYFSPERRSNGRPHHQRVGRGGTFSCTWTLFLVVVCGHVYVLCGYEWPSVCGHIPMPQYLTCHAFIRACTCFGLLFFGCAQAAMSNRVSEDNATRRETVNRELKNCTEVTLHALFYDNVQRLVCAYAARGSYQ